jgi:phosphoribosylformylglycinamidine synthase
LQAVRAFVSAGGAVLGVGEGFAALCRAGLLPGTVATAPEPAKPATHVRVEGRATPFTWAIPAGRVLALEPAAATARYVHPDAVALETAGHIILRYCDAAGGTQGDSVAGICDSATRVIGLLPGVGGPLGRQLFSSVLLGAGRRKEPPKRQNAKFRSDQ